MAKPMRYPEQFLLCLTTEQRQTLDSLHDKTGLSRSHWIRWFIDEGLSAFGPKLKELEEELCHTPNGYRRQ